MNSDIDRQVSGGYTQHAPDYDAWRVRGSRWREQYEAEENDWIIDLVQPRAGMTILDVGAGTGRAALGLAARSDAHVIAADLSRGMLREAQRKRDAAGLAFPALVCANARTLPFDDGVFDAVVCIRVLHLFPQDHWPSFVAEMTRVLRPGGVLLVEFDSPFAGVGWAFAREMIRRRTNSLKQYSYYLWPRETARLFAGLEQRRVYGFWFPGTGRIAGAHPRLNGLMRLARLPGPATYLGNKLLVRAAKPVARRPTPSHLNGSSPRAAMSHDQPRGESVATSQVDDGPLAD